MLYKLGEEVAAQPITMILEEARVRGVPTNPLFEDTGLDPDCWKNPAARVSWPAFCAFLSNARHALGEDGLIEAGRSLPTSRLGRVVACRFAMVSDPVDLYRLLCGPNSGLIEIGYSCVRARLREPAPDRFEIEILYSEEYTPCPDLHAFWRGIFEGMPRFVGFPSATVVIEPLPEGARFEVSLPMRPDRWNGRLRQWLRRLRTRRIPREQVGWALFALDARSQQLAQVVEELERDHLARAALEDRFAKTFQASPVAISVTRESDHLLVDVNESFLRLVGVRRGDIVRLSACKAPWCTRAEIDRIGAEAKRDPHFRDLGYVLQRPDGEVRYASLSREPILIDGEPHVLWQAIDVTDRERANEVLREAEQVYFDLYENAPDMYALVDLDGGIIRRCNRKLCETLGVARSNLVGSPIADFLVADPAEKLGPILGELWRTGSVRDVRLRMRRRRGDMFDVSVSGSAVRGADGKVHQTRLILRNLSHPSETGRSRTYYSAPRSSGS